MFVAWLALPSPPSPTRRCECQGQGAMPASDSNGDGSPPRCFPGPCLCRSPGTCSGSQPPAADLRSALSAVTGPGASGGLVTQAPSPPPGQAGTLIDSCPAGSTFCQLHTCTQMHVRSRGAPVVGAPGGSTRSLGWAPRPSRGCVTSPLQQRPAVGSAGQDRAGGHSSPPRRGGQARLLLSRPDDSIPKHEDREAFRATRAVTSEVEGGRLPLRTGTQTSGQT